MQEHWCGAILHESLLVFLKISSPTDSAYAHYGVHDSIAPTSLTLQTPRRIREHRENLGSLMPATTTRSEAWQPPPNISLEGAQQNPQSGLGILAAFNVSFADIDCYSTEQARIKRTTGV